jgi:formate-nitrite transporter family protein
MADSKSASEILEAVVKDGREELDRASLGLAFSGVAAGLNISFSAVDLGIVSALIGGVGLAAYLVYPLGFLIVILIRAQLFTENTVTPVTVALTDPRAICKEAERFCEHSSNTKLLQHVGVFLS